MFDDAFDGNGAPMHITPMFRADLAAPWGSEAAISKLDNFSNLVYTGLLDHGHHHTPGAVRSCASWGEPPATRSSETT